MPPFPLLPLFSAYNLFGLLGAFFDHLNTVSFSLCCIYIPASLSSYSTSSRTITLPYTSSHYSIIVEGSANKVDNLIQVGMKSLKKYLNLTTASAFLSRQRRFTPVLKGLCRFPLLICKGRCKSIKYFAIFSSFSLKKI